MNEVIFKGLTVKGIYGRRIFETWYKAASMLQSGLDISTIVTHVYPVDEFERAFAMVASGQCGKVVLDWST
jgi:threonine 3-dehydrogenase